MQRQGWICKTSLIYCASVNRDPSVGLRLKAILNRFGTFHKFYRLTTLMTVELNDKRNKRNDKFSSIESNTQPRLL